MDDVEIHYAPFYYVTTASDWNGVVNWYNSAYESDIKLIPHPSQGSGLSQRLGNYYTRIETVIRFTVKISPGDIVRINVFKNLSPTNPTSIGWNQYLWTITGTDNFEHNIFYEGAFRSTFRPNTRLLNFEMIYEKFVCKNENEFYMTEFVYRHEDVLNATSAHNQLVITVNGYHENLADPTSKFKCFAETKFIP